MDLHAMHLDTASVWRWIAALLMAFIVGTYMGQFSPNRNIVTNDQLLRWQTQSAAQVSSVQSAVIALSSTVETLNDEVSELRGELRGRNLLNDPPKR